MSRVVGFFTSRQLCSQLYVSSSAERAWRFSSENAYHFHNMELGLLLSYFLLRTLNPLVSSKARNSRNGLSGRLPRTLGRGRERSTPWSHRRLRNLGMQRVGYREHLIPCLIHLLQEARNRRFSSSGC